MKLSHSKLAKLISCPMSYRLTYELGIWTKVEKPALAIGSAVHWGIEHETDDLSEYFKEQGTFKQGDAYTREQVLAEAMVYGYLTHKDEIFEQILVDPDTGEKLELLEETHELYVTGKLKSFLEKLDHHDLWVSSICCCSQTKGLLSSTTKHQRTNLIGKAISTRFTGTFSYLTLNFRTFRLLRWASSTSRRLRYVRRKRRTSRSSLTECAGSTKRIAITM